MDHDSVKEEVTAAMRKAVDHLLHEFAGVRTGKASPTLVDNIDVSVASYGSQMKLKALAVITTPEPRLILIQPYDQGVVGDIEKALRENQKLGVNPVSDGKVIRLPIPELTEERRKELVKVIKHMAEESRIAVRSCRKDGMDAAKKGKADGNLTEDQMHDLEAEVQEITDKHIKEIDQRVAEKEKEVMTV